MPSLPGGQWLLDYAKLMDKEQCNLIYQCALKVEWLRQKMEAATNAGTKATLASELARWRAMLHELRLGIDGKGCIYYDEASTLSNLYNIGLDYIEQQRDILGDHFYQEILNIRPTKTDRPFYAKLSDKHFTSLVRYDAYDALTPSQRNTCLADRYNRQAPLIVGMDFGANINSMLTAQRDVEARTLNVLKEHFVLSPKIQEDVVNDWCRYYAPHACREVRFHYDNTGNNRTGNTRRTRAEEVKKMMENSGWRVELCTKGGANRAHDVKHQLINAALSGKTPELWRIRINEPVCEALRESLTYAKSKEDERGNIKKDKSSERSKTLPQQYATHLSDAFDVIYCGEFGEAANSTRELYEAWAKLT